jgi:hypothetical protein
MREVRDAATPVTPETKSAAARLADDGKIPGKHWWQTEQVYERHVVLPALQREQAEITAMRQEMTLNERAKATGVDPQHKGFLGFGGESYADAAKRVVAAERDLDIQAGRVNPEYEYHPGISVTAPTPVTSGYEPHGRGSWQYYGNNEAKSSSSSPPDSRVVKGSDSESASGEGNDSGAGSSGYKYSDVGHVGDNINS